MFALLLAAAASAIPVPPTPQVELTFPDAAPVTVTGPENNEKNAEYPWTHQQTLMSPRGDAAAVRFCWEIGKYDGCQVFLARPGQPTLRLKNSDVTRLLWTQDGKYLIGAGENTVRLWNLVGGVRSVVPLAPPIQGYHLPEQLPVPSIVKMQAVDKTLCVWATGRGGPGPSEQGLAKNSSRTTDTRPLQMVSRYSLPQLKRSSSAASAISAGDTCG